MNLFNNLNQMISYIEEHLRENISMDKLATFLGCSSYTMQRIFSMMTGFTVKEYIRNRRLSLSAIDLQNGMKVIDVAIMYGYNSPTSFSRKFFDTFKIHPKDIKNKTINLKFQPVLKFDEKNYNNIIEYRIEEHNEIKLYGRCVRIEDDIPSLAEALWDDMKKQYPSILENLPRYALIENRDKKDYYWVLSKIEYDGLEEFIIPNKKWIIFKTNSFDGNEIKKLDYKVNSEYLKSIPYKKNNRYTLELYYKDYVEIWFLLD